MKKVVVLLMLAAAIMVLVLMMGAKEQDPLELQQQLRLQVLYEVQGRINEIQDLYAICPNLGMCSCPK